MPERQDGHPPDFELEPFRPPVWARRALPQTILAHLLRRSLHTPNQRVRWRTPDQDFLDLDWSAPAAPDAGFEQPLVVVLHGLEGSTRSGYVQETFRQAAAQGMLAVGVNFRGCSGEMNHTPRKYHSGFTQDLDFVLRRLRELYPRAPLAAVGFSLGGNLLLKYLGEDGRRAAGLLDAAVSVSASFDLSLDSPNMERGANRAFTASFLRSLKDKVRRNQDLYASILDLQQVYSARTLREFDDAFVAPVYGFRDAHDYYEQSSSGRYLAGIRTPVLVLRARDDPFFVSTNIPERDFAENPWIFPGITEHGGHVGFVEAFNRFWAERQALRFIAAMLAAPRPAG